MLRYFKIFLCLFTFLDVAILPFSCLQSTNDGEAHIYLFLYDQEGNFLDYEKFQFKYPNEIPEYIEKNTNDVLTQEEVDDYLNNIFENCKLSYIQDDVFIPLTILSYEIENIHLLDKEHNPVEITLPHTFTEEEKVNYYVGMRHPYIIQIAVKVNYTEANNN